MDKASSKVLLRVPPVSKGSGPPYNSHRRSNNILTRNRATKVTRNLALVKHQVPVSVKDLVSRQPQAVSSDSKRQLKIKFLVEGSVSHNLNSNPSSKRVSVPRLGSLPWVSLQWVNQLCRPGLANLLGKLQGSASQ